MSNSTFAYAKLVGVDGKFSAHITELPTTLGRAKPPGLSGGYVIICDTKTVSRKHAVLSWNVENECFMLEILGKNGVNVGKTPIRPAGGKRSIELKSKMPLQIGKRRFYFLAANSENSDVNNIIHQQPPSKKLKASKDTTDISITKTKDVETLKSYEKPSGTKAEVLARILSNEKADFFSCSQLGDMLCEAYPYYKQIKKLGLSQSLGRSNLFEKKQDGRNVFYKLQQIVKDISVHDVPTESGIVKDISVHDVPTESNTQQTQQNQNSSGTNSISNVPNTTHLDNASSLLDTQEKSSSIITETVKTNKTNASTTDSSSHIDVSLSKPNPNVSLSKDAETHMIIDVS